MRRILPIITLLLAPAGFAAEPAKTPTEQKIEARIRQSLPVCPDLKITHEKFERKLPTGFVGSLVKVESSRPPCKAQYASVFSSAGNYYLGTPWFLPEGEGTIEEKVKDVTWRAMRQHITPVVDRTKTKDGLYKITLVETTERGKIPVEAEIDPAGTVLFIGHFQPIDTDVRAVRAKAFEPFLAAAPTQGKADAPTTIIEFSDFECPSCRRSADYVKPILEKHGSKVRYVRYDLPLTSMHPWALSAAIAGRAIYRQKPEAFWQYKKHVYEYQEKLNAFTFDEFARGFAEDQQLDMKKYDEDVASQEVRDQILRGVGTAFTYDVRGTPSYLVNGALVDPGDNGKSLVEYVDKIIQ